MHFRQLRQELEHSFVVHVGVNRLPYAEQGGEVELRVAQWKKCREVVVGGENAL